MAAISFGNFAEITATRQLAASQDAALAQMVAQIARHRSKGATQTDAASLYLTSNNASLARAELQDMATHLIVANGGRLAEAQFTSTPEQEAEGVVAIQLSLDINNHELFDLLWQIETRTPLIEVTDLSIRHKSEGLDSAPAGLLHVDLTVASHFRKGTG